jgi:hypothetical protein
VYFYTLEKKLEDPFAMPMSLPLDFLKSVTRDFSKEQELGRGGSGVVYKVCVYDFFFFSNMFSNNNDRK